MSHNPFKFVVLILAIAILATGCQELTLNVEIPPSSPTGRPAPTALTPTRPAPTVTPAAPTPVLTALPGRLQPGSPVQIAAIRMLDAQQGWGIGNRGTGRQDAILRTADGGLTWRDVTPPLPENLAGSTRQAAAAFTDAQHAWVTYFNPLRYFLVVVRGIFLKGAGPETLWHQMAALFAIGLATLAIAARRFRKTLA